MTKKITLVTAVAFALAFTPIGIAQAADITAEKIFDNYIEAIGGKAAVAAIKNRVAKGEFAIVDMGMTASMESYSEPPNAVTNVEIPGFGEFKNGIKDGLAWSVNPMEGNSILDGDKKTAALRNAALNEFLDWKNWYDKAECVGVEDVDGTECYKVELTDKTGENSTLFFNKEDGLLVQRIAPGQQGGMDTITVSDYKDVGGVLFAHKIHTEGMMTIDITFSSVEHNVAIPPETFDLPDEIEALANPVEDADSDEDADEDSDPAEDSESE